MRYPGDHEATGYALIMIGYIFLFTFGALIVSSSVSETFTETIFCWNHYH